MAKKPKTLEQRQKYKGIYHGFTGQDIIDSIKTGDKIRPIGPYTWAMRFDKFKIALMDDIEYVVKNCGYYGDEKRATASMTIIDTKGTKFFLICELDLQTGMEKI